MSKNLNKQENPLEATYRQHHTHKNRYGFSYRVGERGPQFKKWVGTNKKILDIGCRDGKLTSNYLQENEIIGIDIDQEALQRIRSNLNIEAHWHDLNQAPLAFDANSFDVVVAGEILEHLISPQFVAKEALRVLKPGGLFIGSVPNSFHWRARLAFVKGYSIEDATHLQLFSYQRIQTLLTNFSNFEILTIGGIGGRRIPVLPTTVSTKLVNRFPSIFANDFLFCAQK